MTGVVCLQGGAESTPGCREMDAELLARTGGPVVVVALASTPGQQAAATQQSLTHFRGLEGAQDVEVSAAPDDAAEARAAVRRARLVVLPGGSPARLLEALRETGLDGVLAELLDAGGSVLGSSAGAMVLGERLVLPDRGHEVVDGLALVPGVAVVPHWTGTGPQEWLERLLAEPLLVLGVPEQSGVVVSGDVLTAVGRAATRLLPEDRDLGPGASTGRVVGGAA